MIRSIVQHPLAIFLLSAIVTIAGITAALTLPVKLQPNVNEPIIMISAHVKLETDLSTMEKEIAIPLETLAMSKDIVKNVRATTTTKDVQIEVLLKDSAQANEVDKLKEELKQRVSQVSLDLDYSNVQQYSSADNVIMVIAVTSDDEEPNKVRTELMEMLIPELRAIAGVSKIEHTLDLFKEEYKFELKPDKVRNLQQASSLIEELSNGFSSPLLGSLEYDGSQYRVRSASPLATVQDLEQYRFESGERLTDLAELRVDIPADHSYNMVSGQPYYEIDVFASDRASEVKVSERVRAVMAKYYEEQGSTNWEYIYAWDASTFIGLAVKELVLNIMIGALIAAAILFIVFRSIRTTLIVALSMPICIFTTLISMAMFGYSINIITMMGIGLGTGMIVDACIVVIENIHRKMLEGGNRLDAVVEGTKEVFAPVLASILTTIAVFLPISFLDGMIGEFMKQLGLTVTVSLAASLVVSLTLIPILANKLMKETKEVVPSTSKLLVLYEKVLVYVLKRKWRTLLSFVLLLVISIYALLAFVPKGYIPNVSDRSLFVNLEVDHGIDYEMNMQMMDHTAEQLLPIDGVKEVLYWGHDTNTSRGAFIILFEDRKDMEQSDMDMKDQIQQTIDETIPYSFLSIGEGQGDTSGQMSISLSASTMEELIQGIPAIKDEIGLLPGVTGTQAALTEGSKEWVIHFSREQLSHHKLTRSEVEQYISLVLNGVHDIDVKVDGVDTKASIEFPSVYRQSSDALYQMPISSDMNLTIGDVASIEQVDSESSRVRMDGSYEIILNIYFDSAVGDQVISSVTDFVDMYRGDLRISLSGAQQQQAEGFVNLLIAVAISFATVFIILTVQFNRLRLPFLIMLSLPFAMIGVALGFLLTGRTFDIMAMIGIVMLVGIVVNNAIVLIDFINKHRVDYPDIVSAIIEGAKVRVRPILTTTLTTVGGLLPMFLGVSEASAFQTPIATAVIFGLLFSTFVSLILVPVLYYLFEGGHGKNMDQAVRPVNSSKDSKSHFIW